MKRPFSVFCATFLCMSTLALSSYGATVVRDTFTDADRTDPTAANNYSEYYVDGDLDGDIESGWYRGGTGSTLTATPGHLLAGVAAASASFSTWFTTPSTLLTLADPGNQIKVTWNFTMTGLNPANANQGLRLALADSSQVARRTSDNSPADGIYSGYAMFMNIAPTLNQSNPFQLLERNAFNGNFLSSSGNWAGLANSGATGDPGYAAGTAYSYVLTLTLGVAGQLDIVSTMTGAGLGTNNQGYLTVSYTDTTSPNLSFDLFGLRPATSSATATGFDTTLFQVEFIPEPSTLALTGVAMFGLIACYRRSRR